MERILNGKRRKFSLTAPTARMVQLVGDFTHWTENPIEMNRHNDGVWRASVKIQPGKHRYRFLVDGVWQDDPECTAREQNPYGSEDAVLQIG